MLDSDGENILGAGMNEKSPNCIFRAQLMSLAFQPRPCNEAQRKEMAALFALAGADDSKVTVVWGHI
jgi:hypothetical protein